MLTEIPFNMSWKKKDIEDIAVHETVRITPRNKKILLAHYTTLAEAIRAHAGMYSKEVEKANQLEQQLKKLSK